MMVSPNSSVTFPLLVNAVKCKETRKRISKIVELIGCVDCSTPLRCCPLCKNGEVPLKIMFVNAVKKIGLFSYYYYMSIFVVIFSSAHT